MYHTWVLNENYKNQKFLNSLGVVTFGDPKNDLNDLEKNVAYDFQLDGSLKIPNQQQNQFGQ